VLIDPAVALSPRVGAVFVAGEPVFLDRDAFSRLQPSPKESLNAA